MAMMMVFSSLSAIIVIVNAHKESNTEIRANECCYEKPTLRTRIREIVWLQVNLCCCFFFFFNFMYSIHRCTDVEYGYIHPCVCVNTVLKSQNQRATHCNEKSLNGTVQAIHANCQVRGGLTRPSDSLGLTGVSDLAFAGLSLRPMKKGSTSKCVPYFKYFVEQKMRGI